MNAVAANSKANGKAVARVAPLCCSQVYLPSVDIEKPSLQTHSLFAHVASTWQWVLSLQAPSVHSAVAEHVLAVGSSSASQPAGLPVEQVTAPGVPWPSALPQAVSQPVASFDVHVPQSSVFGHLLASGLLFASHDLPESHVTVPSVPDPSAVPHFVTQLDACTTVQSSQA